LANEVCVYFAGIDLTPASKLRLESPWAFAVYFVIAAAVVDRGLVDAHVTNYIGTGTDPPMLMWFLNWWPWALAHRLNPFWSYMVWAPVGVNLTWTTCVPLPALVSAPIQRALGLVAAYNMLVTIAMPTAGWCAFLLCRRLTHAFWPALVGGYLFGFSPFMLGRALGHLSLLTIFPIPLIALLALRGVAGEVSARRYAGLLALLLIVQFLCTVEVYATLTFFGAIALLLALYLFEGETRRAIAGLIAPTAAAYAISVAVLSPYFYFMLMQGFPDAPLWDPGRYSADLLSLAVPTATMWLGVTHPARAIAAGFGGYAQENGAYIGIPMLVVAEDFRRRNWATPAGKLLILMLAIAIIAALGPHLRIMGKPTALLPWAMMLKLPAISNALPARFTMYASLIVAIIAALWFAGGRGALTKSVAVIAIAISLFPNPHASFWVSPLEFPAFFAAGAYRTAVKPNELLLVLPFGQRGASMYWQARSAMSFRMASGYTGPWPPEFEQMPTAQFLYGAIDLPERVDQLKAYVARFGVEAILADEQEPLFPVWRPVLDGLGIQAARREGFRIYNLPRDAFAAYAKLSPTYVEARAVSLRFDAILSAAAQYLAAGGQAPRLSPPTLKRSGLLPGDWEIDADTVAFRDWDIAALEDGRIAIIVLASYPTAQLLIDRYRADATEIRYPMSQRWRPGSASPRNRTQPRTLLLIFDRAHLSAAAARLRSSPPPEMTTGFLAGSAAIPH